MRRRAGGPVQQRRRDRHESMRGVDADAVDVTIEEVA
jgi:hypothetical protein